MNLTSSPDFPAKLPPTGSSNSPIADIPAAARRRRIASSDRCPTLDDVQRRTLGILLKACEIAETRLIVADTVQGPRIVVWICGTGDQQVATVRAAKDLGLFVKELKKPFKTFDISKDEPLPPTAVAYQYYMHGDAAVHSHTSGIEIEFAQLDEAKGSINVARAGVQCNLRQDEIGELPRIDLFSYNLPILPNALGVAASHLGARPIDIVYTWVDGQDPAWQARKSGRPEIETTYAANSAARFHSCEELLYSIRSVITYFKNHGRIFVVTDQQTPTFLGDLLNEVTIVDHREIFDDPSHLPCFNSHAIGAQLYRIPGLSDRYLYLNDDILFGRPVCGALFFDQYGRARQFPSNYAAIPSSKIGEVESSVDAAARNNRELLQRKYGFYIYRKFRHSPIAVEKATMCRMAVDLEEAWQATLPNHLRTAADYSIAGNLYLHYAAIQGRSIDGNARYDYLDVGNANFPEKIANLIAQTKDRPEFYCLNDVVTSEFTDANKVIMLDALGKMYPTSGVKLKPRPSNPRRQFKALSKLDHAEMQVLTPYGAFTKPPAEPQNPSMLAKVRKSIARLRRRIIKPKS